MRGVRRKRSACIDKLVGIVGDTGSIGTSMDEEGSREIIVSYLVGKSDTGSDDDARYGEYIGHGTGLCSGDDSVVVSFDVGEGGITGGCLGFRDERRV